MCQYSSDVHIDSNEICCILSRRFAGADVVDCAEVAGWLLGFTRLFVEAFASRWSCSAVSLVLLLYPSKLKCIVQLAVAGCASWVCCVVGCGVCMFRDDTQKLPGENRLKLDLEL